MARIILAIVAVACAFVASNATPAIRNVEQQIQSAKLQSQQSVDFSDKFALESLDWLNVTDIIIKVEQALDVIQQKINEASQQVEETVENAIEVVTQNALDAAAKWNSTINEYADKAAAAGVNIQDCLQKQSSLADVLAELKNDAVVCANENNADLMKALDNLKKTVPKAKALLEEAKNQIVVCNEKPNPIATGICLISTMPTVNVKAAALVAEAGWKAGLVAAKAAAVLPVAGMCASKAAVARGNEASAIVNATVQCIKEKLGN